LIKDQKKSGEESNQQRSNRDEQPVDVSGQRSTNGNPAPEPQPKPESEAKTPDPRRIIREAKNFNDSVDEGSSLNLRDLFGGNKIVEGDEYTSQQGMTIFKIGELHVHADSTTKAGTAKTKYNELFDASLAILNGFEQTLILLFYEHLSDLWLKSSLSDQGSPSEEELIKDAEAERGVIRKRSYGTWIQVQSLQFKDRERVEQVLANLSNRFTRDFGRIIEVDNFEVQRRVAFTIGNVRRADLPFLMDSGVYQLANSDLRSRRALAGYFLQGVAQDADSHRFIQTILTSWAKSSNPKLKWSAAFTCGLVGVQYFDLVSGTLELLLTEQLQDLRLIVLQALYNLAFDDQITNVVHALREWIEKALKEWTKELNQEKFLEILLATGLIADELLPPNEDTTVDQEEDDLKESRIITWQKIAASTERSESTLIKDFAYLFHMGLKRGYKSGINLILIDLVKSWIQKMEVQTEMKIGVMAIIRQIYEYCNPEEQQRWRERLHNWETTVKEGKSSFAKVSQSLG